MKKNSVNINIEQTDDNGFILRFSFIRRDGRRWTNRFVFAPNRILHPRNDVERFSYERVQLVHMVKEIIGRVDNVLLHWTWDLSGCEIDVFNAMKEPCPEMFECRICHRKYLWLSSDGLCDCCMLVEERKHEM